MADCRYRLWSAILCIPLVRAGGKLQCSLKNNRQPWECTEMKGQDKACQEITFQPNDFFIYIYIYIKNSLL